MPLKYLKENIVSCAAPVSACFSVRSAFVHDLWTELLQDGSRFDTSIHCGTFKHHEQARVFSWGNGGGRFSQGRRTCRIKMTSLIQQGRSWSWCCTSASTSAFLHPDTRLSTISKYTTTENSYLMRTHVHRACMRRSKQKTNCTLVTVPTQILPYHNTWYW